MHQRLLHSMCCILLDVYRIASCDTVSRHFGIHFSDLQEATQAAQAAAAREQSLTSQARDLSAQVKLLTDASAGLQADVMRRSEQEATMKTSLSEQQLRASHAEHEVARLNKEVSLHKVNPCCADL